MKLFHTTTRERMSEILRDGFDERDRQRLEAGFGAVASFNVAPLGPNDGYSAGFDAFYMIDVPDDTATDYAVKIWDDTKNDWALTGEYAVPLADLPRFPHVVMDRDDAEFRADQAQGVAAAERLLKPT